MKITSLVNIITFFICALFFSVFSRWEIFEQDLFWLTRAGAEILQNLSVQTTDSWSYTAKGETWYHFQWLTSILFYFWQFIFGSIESLIYLRCTLVFILFFILGLILHANNSQKKFSSLLCLFILPITYLIIWIRLQLRPDLIGIIFFSGLVLVQTTNSKKKHLWSLILLFFWSNFHAGTTVLGLFYFFTSLFFEIILKKSESTMDLSNSEQKKYFFQYIAFGLLAWFATPIHFHIIEVLLQTTEVSNNPDLQPFALRFLEYSQGGSGYLLLFLLLITLMIYTALTDFKKSEHRNLYKNKLFVITIALVFFILFLQKMRTAPYLLIALFPLIPFAFNTLFFRAKKRIISYVSLAIVLAGIWLYLIPDQRHLAEPLGVKISESWFPVKSVEFIKQQKPQGQMYNFFNFGGYLIYKLPEYPVFYDGRETPFLKLDADRTLAAQEPKKYQLFLKKYNINFVLESRPEGNMISQFQRFYPAEEWARVFTDLASTVFVRRIPEHYRIIDQFERSGGHISGMNSKQQINLSPQEIQGLLEQARQEIEKRKKQK